MTLGIISPLPKIFQGLRIKIQVTVKDISSSQFLLNPHLQITQTQSSRMVKFHQKWYCIYRCMFIIPCLVHSQQKDKAYISSRGMKLVKSSTYSCLSIIQIHIVICFDSILHFKFNNIYTLYKSDYYVIVIYGRT